MSSRLISELQNRVNSQMLIIDELRESNRRLKEGTEVDALMKKIRKLEYQLNEVIYEVVYEEPSVIKKQQSISTDMLKRLKQLAHPDKHGNSELSNTVMKFLNSL